MALTVEQIAAICHETNRAYCTQLGDNSQPPWEDAPEWQRASAINGVKHIMENPGAGPIDSHKSWLKQKKEEGWVYGPVKNVELKQHPCMVPYASLPETQQLKDRLFISVVKCFL